MEWAVTGGGELAVKEAGTQKWGILFRGGKSQSRVYVCASSGCHLDPRDVLRPCKLAVSA